MKWSLYLGRLWGTELRLHWSLALLVPYVFWLVSSNGDDQYALVSLLFALLFVSVALHEVGHMLAARYFGIETRSIVLWVLGGLANFEHAPAKPWHSVLISVAGPSVNALLALLLFALGWLPLFQNIEFGNSLWYAEVIRRAMFAGNTALAVFNLIPAYPLDGGHIFRALLTMLVGEQRANLVAMVLGVVFATGLALYAISEQSLIWIVTALLIALGAGTLNSSFNRSLNWLFDAGYVFIEQKEFDRAIAYYDWRNRFQPRRAMSYNNRGYAYRLKREYTQALADFDQAIKLDPKLRIAYGNRLHVRKLIDDRQGAYEDYLAIAALIPKSDAKTLPVYGVHTIGDDDQAFTIVENLLVQEPTNGQALTTKAYLYLALRDSSNTDLAQAEALLQQCVDHGVALWATHANRGWLALYRGTIEQAHQCFQQAIVMEPIATNALIGRGICEELLGNDDDALKTYQQVLQLDAEEEEVYYLIGRLLHRLGRSDEALAQVEQSLDVRTTAGLSPQLITWRRLFRNDFAWAITYFSHAVKIAPSDYRSFISRGDVYLVHGHYAEAVADYEQALQLRPHDELLTLYYADALRLAGHTEQARTMYTELARTTANGTIRRCATEALALETAVAVEGT